MGRRQPLRTNLIALAVLVLAAPLWGQTGPLSPRESYDHALVLFGQGHVFTPDELQSLDTLRGKLADAGDADLAGDVAVLRLAALAAADRAAAYDAAQSSLASDSRDIANETERQRTQSGWRLTRDIGLTTFSISTVATLLLAFTAGQDDLLIKNLSGATSAKQQLNNALPWVTAGSAGVMLLSLFPLIIGQTNL